MFSAVDGFYTDAKDETFSEGVLGGYKGNKSVVEDLEAYVDKSIKMAIYCPDGAIAVSYTHLLGVPVGTGPSGLAH